MGKIYLGTSGYSFDDWIGRVYPEGIKKSQMFAYYLNNFGMNSVEINYTYYKMPARKVFQHYAAITPEDFRFSVKLFSGITHEPWIGERSGKLDQAACSGFLEGIYPLVDVGRLGCLLAQFPPHLTPTENAWQYLYSLKEAFFDLPLVYEFRNKRWISQTTFAALRNAGIGFCAVDQPQIGPLMPLVPEVTSDTSYLRLHGRSANWFSDSKLRYDYLYSEEELRSFLPDIRQMQSQSKIMFIQFNNCHAGSAVRNAQMMKQLLDMDVPPTQGVLM